LDFKHELTSIANTVNSGSPLNRLSFLRTDHTLLSNAIKHPSTSFLLLSKLWPLAKDPTKLAYASYTDVKSLIGEDPYAKTEEQLIREYNSSLTTPIMIFLGIDEKNKDGLAHGIYKGAPYFALDVTPKGSIEKEAKGVTAEMEKRGLRFLESRMHINFPASEGRSMACQSLSLNNTSIAAIYAQARSLIDWNTKNPFCAQCGQTTLSINGGYKRTCPPTDFSSKLTTGSTTPETPTERPPCATRKGVHNLAFPRTDPTVIMAVLSPDSRRVLVGRQKRWPQYWYSTLAGFVEPAESIEEAVRREVWEESGVQLGRVVIHSTQPWPYPANLMIGAIAQAIPGGDKINLEHDPELEDAKWVDIEEVAEALKVGTSGLGEPPNEGYVEGNLRLPPETAIANQLLKAVVNGFVSGDSKI
jgi:NAD+ diphosphatase